MPRTIHTVDEVLQMLESMFRADADKWTERAADWWDSFYEDRDRGVPFFREGPDESLATWLQQGQLVLPLADECSILDAVLDGTPCGSPSRAITSTLSTCR